MPIGIEIHFNDEFRAREWIDPVDEGTFDDMILDVEYLYKIHNMYKCYTYYKSEIKEFIKYQLTECCGYDTRTGYHSYKCENGD